MKTGSSWNSTSVTEWIREFLAEYRETWWELSTALPELPFCSIREQRELERELEPVHP